MCKCNNTKIIAYTLQKYWFSFAITNRATSGGTRRLKNPDTNADTVSQSYNGHSVQNTLEFRFDFDVPTHCVQTSACPTNAMELEDDTTMVNVYLFLFRFITHFKLRIIIFELVPFTEVIDFIPRLVTSKTLN